MFPAVAILRYKDPERHRPFRIPGGDRAVIAMSVITCVIIAAGVVLFLWPEIPAAPKEWSYTGPLLGIVGITLAAGEVMLWRMSHPRHPHTQGQIEPQPQPRPTATGQPVATLQQAATGQPAPAGRPATLSVGGRRA
jgi:hypothetical protein